MADHEGEQDRLPHSPEDEVVPLAYGATDDGQRVGGGNDDVHDAIHG